MKVLIVFAHPAFESSRINRALYESVKDLPDVTWHDLYDTYPQQMINVQYEQALLTQADVVILQHPLYWYSCPALMKNWLDSVLTLGWAYGEGGTALRGKAFLQAVSSGGPEAVYQRGGYNNFTLAELLRPFEQTADLCDMTYHQPFMTQGVRNLTDEILTEQVARYREWINAIVAGQLPPVVNTHHASQADYERFV
jgi:glutathione-regulated potassium-efflux system ancillary protein KefG